MLENDPDREARLEGLRQSVSLAQTQLADNHSHQLPPDVMQSVKAVGIVLVAEPLSWYGIDDARQSLRECLDSCADMPETALSRNLGRIVTRLEELRPLLQPRQVPADAPDAKPPETEPIISATQVAAVENLAEMLEAELGSSDAIATLDPAAQDYARTAIAQITSAKDATDDKGKFARLRRGLKGMAYFTGGVTAAVGTGVVVNLLTAPEAALTLAARLKPILDAVLQFFL